MLGHSDGFAAHHSSNPIGVGIISPISECVGTEVQEHEITTTQDSRKEVSSDFILGTPDYG